MAGTEYPVAPQTNSSLFGWLWRGWLQKRKRDRARSLAQVRFRLTREGIHFVGILMFIFLAAILRDLNLLVLLAGVMIGLLILQWRFTTRSLLGLSVTRYLPRNTPTNQETRVDLRLSNPKAWLASWLVLVDEPLQRISPVRQKSPERASAVVDEVKPASSSHTHYKLTFQQRGRYQIGPSTISTRFPLGLGRGFRTLDNSREIVALPRLGQLTARAQSLYQQEFQGNSKSSPKAGMHEADFYGLRPWTTGDSQRWIHWRTTARLGELTVRQFEQQQRRQICVLLDLFAPKDRHSADTDAFCETAISFLATLAVATASHGSDHMAAAVASNELVSLPRIRSALLVESFLEQLAVLSPSESPLLSDAIRGITVPLINNPRLLVISTRDDHSHELRKEFAAQGSSLLARIKINWLNVARGQLEPYFSWT